MTKVCPNCVCGCPGPLPNPNLWKTKERLSNFERQFNEGADFVFGVFNLGETELLASTGLHTRVEDSAREIGYWVHSKYTGQGIATEIIQALTVIAFEVEGLQRLEIRCDERNTGSYTVAKKAGFMLKETLKYNMKDVNGVLRNTMVWEMTANGYRKLTLPDLPVVAFDKAGAEIPLFA